SRPSFLDGRDAHPTNLWKLFNSHSLLNYQPALKVVIVNDLIYCTGKKLRLLFYDLMMRI
ncbi:hypothetical protein, partial [Microcoleus sp. S13_D1]